MQKIIRLGKNMYIQGNANIKKYKVQILKSRKGY